MGLPFWASSSLGPFLRPKIGSFFLHLQNFFYTSKLSLNSQKILLSFKETATPHPKIMSTSDSQNILFPEVKIYHRKSTSENQNESPEVKNYHQKSTSGSQKIFPKVNFRKSKNIPRSRFPEVKKILRKLTSVSQKTKFILNICNSF